MSNSAIRAENVDVEDRLRNLAEALSQVQQKCGYPVICSLHPRTRHKMQEYGVGAENDQVRYLTPLGLFDFVALERNARCVLSDSGTVQEEGCIFRVPTVTLRDMTERPETAAHCGGRRPTRLGAGGHLAAPAGAGARGRLRRDRRVVVKGQIKFIQITCSERLTERPES